MHHRALAADVAGDENRVGIAGDARRCRQGRRPDHLKPGDVRFLGISFVWPLTDAGKLRAREDINNSAGPVRMSKRSKRQVRGPEETERAWGVIGYEVKMFHAMYELVINPAFTEVPRSWANAIEEADVLHTRILCEIFLDLGDEDNNIKLSNLLPRGAIDSQVKEIRSELFKQYGNPKSKHSPR
jgi:hypothetical protein